MWIFNGKCKLCKGKAIKPRYYYDDNGKKIKVCIKCVEYAERRAFRLYRN